MVRGVQLGLSMDDDTLDAELDAAFLELEWLALTDEETEQ